MFPWHGIEKYMYGSSGLGKGELSTDERYHLIAFFESPCATKFIYAHATGAITLCLAPIVAESMSPPNDPQGQMTANQ